MLSDTCQLLGIKALKFFIISQYRFTAVYSHSSENKASYASSSSLPWYSFTKSLHCSLLLPFSTCSMVGGRWMVRRPQWRCWWKGEDGVTYQDHHLYHPTHWDHTNCWASLISQWSAHTAQNLRGSLACQKVTQVELGGSCWRILPEGTA